MDEFAQTGGVDGLIADLGGRQHGVVARWQLLARGVGRGAIDGRVLRKRLHPVHRGVYALSSAPLEPLARWMAAVLAGNEGAVLSHWSAGSLWRLRPGIGPRSHVTSPRQRRSSATITFHESRLAHDEITLEQAIPTATPARTLLDLAPLLPSPVLGRMLDAAPSQGAPLAALLERYPRRPGAGKLRALLDQLRPMTRSDLEAQVLAAIEAAGLPRPSVNTVIEGYEVDFAWPAHRVIAELDTYVTHGSPHAFELDRERDRKLTLTGWTVMRVTSPEDVDDLSRLLAATATRSRAAA